MKNFPKTKDRFVVYFDLMGFKDLVYRSSHDEVSRVMDTVCGIANYIKDFEVNILENGEGKPKGSFGKTVVLPVVFSDSIIFISKGNTLLDAKKSIYVASYFLHNVLRENIALKGALSYGRFTADFEKSSFFGRPLIDAYLLANETHFYGAVLHNTFDRYLNDKSLIIKERMLKRAPVPMKGGAVTHSFIDWGFHMKGDSVSANKQTKLIEKFYEGVSGNTRLYVDNTMKVHSSKI